MKKQPANRMAKTPPPPPAPTIPLPEEESDPPAESIGLSPKRIKDGVSTTSDLLRDILLRDQHTHYQRHWGINE